MRAFPLLLLQCSLLLLCGRIAADGGVATLEGLVTEITGIPHLEQFLQLHKPRLGKVFFISEQGKTTLCEKLATDFEGTLDFGAVAESATDVLTQLGLAADELPAVFVLSANQMQVTASTQGTYLNLQRYDGDFSFGVSSRLTEFLARFAPPIPEAHAISSQEQFASLCAGPFPCVVSVLSSQDKFIGVKSQLAKLYAGENVVLCTIDTDVWAEPQKQYGFPTPSAFLTGPFGKKGGNILSVMPDAMTKDFNVTAVELFIYESRRLAAAAISSDAPPSAPLIYLESMLNLQAGDATTRLRVRAVRKPHQSRLGKRRQKRAHRSTPVVEL